MKAGKPALPSGRLAGSTAHMSGRRWTMANATARALGGLLHDLNDEELLALTDSNNRRMLREFLVERVMTTLPTKMVVGGRTYDILSFLYGHEDGVLDEIMYSRVKEMSACNGRDEREHILKYQYEIPTVLRGKLIFLFLEEDELDDDEDEPDIYHMCRSVGWGHSRWEKSWDGRRIWGKRDRVLRRVA